MTQMIKTTIDQSKAFEKCLYDQIYAYTDSILSKAQCGFRKGYSTQYSIIAITEKWRGILDQGGICGALFTDLSKASDRLIESQKTYSKNKLLI